MTAVLRLTPHPIQGLHKRLKVGIGAPDGGSNGLCRGIPGGGDGGSERLRRRATSGRQERVHGALQDSSHRPLGVCRRRGGNWRNVVLVLLVVFDVLVVWAGNLRGFDYATLGEAGRLARWAWLQRR